MVYGNFPEFVIRLKSVIRSSSVTRSRFNDVSDHWSVLLYMVMFDEIHISTIKLPGRRFKIFPELSLPRMHKLIEK